MRIRPVAGIALSAALAAGATAAVLHGPAVARAQSSPAGSITVTGQAQVAVTDLNATFNVGVERQASTAQAALSGDNRLMQRVIAALEAKGVPAHDLQTVNLSVNPQYQQSNGPGPGAITGFDASDDLQVTVTDTAQVGPLIDAALAAGANSVDNVSFVAADPARSQSQALASAVADAKSQAQVLATAGGLTLGAPTSITTQVQGPEPVFNTTLAAAVPSASTPVLAGAQTVSAQVTVVFSARAD